MNIDQQDMTHQESAATGQYIEDESIVYSQITPESWLQMIPQEMRSIEKDFIVAHTSLRHAVNVESSLESLNLFHDTLSTSQVIASSLQNIIWGVDHCHRSLITNKPTLGPQAEDMSIKDLRDTCEMSRKNERLTLRQALDLCGSLGGTLSTLAMHKNAGSDIWTENVEFVSGELSFFSNKAIGPALNLMDQAKDNIDDITAPSSKPKRRRKETHHTEMERSVKNDREGHSYRPDSSQSCSGSASSQSVETPSTAESYETPRSIQSSEALAAFQRDFSRFGVGLPEPKAGSEGGTITPRIEISSGQYGEDGLPVFEVN